MRKGIDISKYQGKVNWNKVKADEIEFVMLRCGTGFNGGSKDAMFETNYKSAKDVGLFVGAYFYSYALNEEEAIKEADFVLSLLEGKKFEYPIAFDIEDKSQQKLGKEKISAIIKAFCEKLENAGYYVQVYSSKSWLEKLITDEVKSKYDTWVAQWSKKCTYTGSYGMWQNSAKGVVNGIAGDVDTNISHKDYPYIIKKNMLNGYKKNNPEVISFMPGDKVKVKNPIHYDTNKKFKLWFNSYDVLSVQGNRAVIGKFGIITAPIHVKYLTKVYK